MKINRFETLETLLQKTQERLNEVFLENKEKPVLFLSSGGSSLSLLNNFEYILNPNITVAMLDERAYTDPSANNFSQLMQTEFYQQGQNSGGSFINTQMRENETPEEFAERYGNAIKRWIDGNKDGVIIATIGLGGDGHVAGMMPHSLEPELFNELFVDTTKTVVSYDASGKNEFANRVSVTMPILKKVNYPIVFFHGVNKREPWSRVMADEGELNETPSRILREMKNVEVYCDLKGE
jgi:6-phosphogluconolactonase/glucosamine-6-phosphate isomerase/deaminase